MNNLQVSCVVPEGLRGQGFKGSSEILKNYKELNVWQKSYELCLKIYRITAKFPNEEKISSPASMLS